MSFNMSLINNASSSNAVTKESVQVLSIETRKSFSFGPNVFELNLIESELAALNNLKKKKCLLLAIFSDIPKYTKMFFTKRKNLNLKINMVKNAYCPS